MAAWLTDAISIVLTQVNIEEEAWMHSFCTTSSLSSWDTHVAYIKISARTFQCHGGPCQMMLLVTWWCERLSSTVLEEAKEALVYYYPPHFHFHSVTASFGLMDGTALITEAMLVQTSVGDFLCVRRFIHIVYRFALSIHGFGTHGFNSPWVLNWQRKAKFKFPVVQEVISVHIQEPFWGHAGLRTPLDGNQRTSLVMST